MEFNPLDLLASAAELQQKNDGDPEPAMTRSQSKNTSTRQVTAVSLKDNSSKLNNNNNNNNLKNKETGHILRKIKIQVNPDLEKMLNEHNYGNAKKSAKYERDIDLLMESKVSPRSDWKSPDNFNESDSVVEEDTEEANEQECNGTDADDSTSQCESEVCFTCGGHIALNKGSRSDSTSSFGPNCGCQADETEEGRSGDGVVSVVETCKDCGHLKPEMGTSSHDISKVHQVYCECGMDSKLETCDSKCSFNHLDNKRSADSCEKCKLLQGSKESLGKETDIFVSAAINRDKPLDALRDADSKVTIVKVTEPLVKALDDDKSTSDMTTVLNKSEVSLVKDPQREGSTDETGNTERETVDGCESLAAATIDKTDAVVPENETPTSLSAKYMFESGQKLDKCSFKSFDLDTSLCTDSSVSSVHLLSPDRRNPDSMGVVESPSSNPQPELPCFEEQTSSSFVKTSQSLDDELSQDYQADSSLACNSESSNSGSGKLNVKLTEPDNSANNIMKEKNNIPVFRFDSDHCYAGLPEKVNKSQISSDQDASLPSESDDVSTPLSSGGGYLSQDSGYEDVTQSPDGLIPTPVPAPHTETSQTVLRSEPLPRINTEKQTVSSLVPVLLSVNDNGSFTVHNSKLPTVTSGLARQVFAVSDNSAAPDSGLKLISGSSLTSLSQTPILLSPVGKNIAQVSVQEPIKESTAIAPAAAATYTESSTPVPFYSSELAAHLTSPIKISSSSQQVSPPKYGKFRIGTFASFSNTGMDDKVKFNSSHWSDGLSSSASSTMENKKSSPSANSYLGSLVQKVKSNLLPLPLPNPQVLNGQLDHIQHDHDYCMKDLMPSVVSSSLENKLKENMKAKAGHGRGRKPNYEEKPEGRSFKRKRGAPPTHKEELDDLDLEDEAEAYTSGFARPKTRAEKYIEQKSVEPKVKITGSSNFQDQFVYFMNTKKRSRRRESRDSPVTKPVSHPMFVPPKPGDIIVPHLTDQDIENLKLRSKRQHKNSPISGYNSLRNEFMAAKLSNGTFSSQAVDPSPLTAAADEEKNIINTILSMEESIAAGNMGSGPMTSSTMATGTIGSATIQTSDESEVPYNESMEMYGQGLSGDIMNLLPDQMNLTQEQMDMLFSAVDEVQNSSPGFIDDDDKLVPTSGASTVTGSCDPTFGQLPLTASPLPASPLPASGFESNDLIAPQAMDISEKGAKITDTEIDVEKSGDETSVKETEVEDETTHPEGKPSTKLDKEVPPKTELPLTEPTQDAEELSSPQEVSLSESKLETRGQPSPVSSSVETSATTMTMTVSEPLSSGTPTDTNGFLTNDIQSSPSVGSSMNLSEISLPSCSLDLLNNDLAKTDMLSESSSSTAASTPSSGSEMRSKDYNAPWIVTVSMYWNDLPAVMMNNHPYVRLVDIHKQILPAKDTGILKKRCQLMGIPVENCSEMQRYFLVQYGRAFNSKSTLIISKDNAKDLIGYYVDPQPRTVKPYDHKSIIDHRREQLRRIALARRASVKAQKSADKEDDTHVSKVTKTDNAESITGLSAHPRVEPGIVTAPSVDNGSSRQRSTRHKKINFLELLRGDTGTTGAEDDGEEEDVEKKTTSKYAPRKRKSVEKKLKIESFTVETDSNGETTETNESEFGSSDETTADSGSEIVVVTKPVKYNLPESRFKPKSKLMKYVRGQAKRPTINIKTLTGANKMRQKSKGVGRSTLLNVKVVGNRSSDGKNHREVFKHWSQSSRGMLSSDACRSDTNVTTEFLSEHNKSVGAVVRQNNSVPLSEVMCRNQTDELGMDAWPQNICMSSSSKLLPDEDISHNVHKISDTPPDDILETYTTKEMETNTDFDGNEDQKDADDGQGETSHKSNGTCEASTDTIESVSERDVTVTENGVNQSESHQPVTLNIPVMRRKEVIKVNSDEVSLRIIHREERMTGETTARARSQIGEVFVGRYVSKKSLCIRCYTCRKFMSVDNFSRHLHDVVSGGLIKVDDAQTISPVDSHLSGPDEKLWNVFEHKKELFENNRLPSPADEERDKLFFMNSQGPHSLDCEPSIVSPEAKPVGPRVINTPVSPQKKQKTLQVIRKKPSYNRTGVTTPAASKPRKAIVTETVEGTRSSSRKRKMKQLYPFEEYSFAKFPRLQHGHEETNTSNTEHRE